MIPTTAMLANNFELPVNALTISSAISSSATLEMWFAIITRLGELHTNPHWKNLHGNQSAGVQIKTGNGMLNRVVVNNAQASGTGITLYDGVGTTVSPIAAFLTSANNLTPTTFNYDLPFYYGLYAVTSTTASNDYTVVFE